MMRDFKPYVPSAREAAVQRFRAAQRRSRFRFIIAAAALAGWLVYMPFAYVHGIEARVIADLHDELCDDTDNMTDTCVEWRGERGAL
jgi:hypothetical protein